MRVPNLRDRNPSEQFYFKSRTQVIAKISGFCQDSIHYRRALSQPLTCHSHILPTNWAVE